MIVSCLTMIFKGFFVYGTERIDMDWISTCTCVILCIYYLWCMLSILVCSDEVMGKTFKVGQMKPCHTGAVYTAPSFVTSWLCGLGNVRRTLAANITGSQYRHGSGLIVVAPLFSVWPENYQLSLDLITFIHTWNSWEGQRQSPWQSP